MCPEKAVCWRALRMNKKMNKHLRGRLCVGPAGFRYPHPGAVENIRLSTDAQTFPSEAAIPQGVDQSVTRSRAVTDSTPPQEQLTAMASQRARADQPKGTKVPPPTKEQQAPKHPMETRKRKKQANDGSRAGGFRPGVGGSGQTDTCVASSHPSQT
jgi:hypothetical protein